jgi:Flp pilus assembly protein TadD
MVPGAIHQLPKVIMIPAAGYRQLGGTVVLGVTLLTFVSGCASHGPSWSGRFVKPGEPSATFDDPATAAPAPKAPKPESLSDYARRLRTIQANARTTISLGNTIESHDPVLASALLKLKMLPTAANHREVARAYTNAGVTDFAFRHYQQALRILPCDSRALEGLARLWRQWGTPELALTEAHRAVHCSPGSASAYNTLGTVLVALGQLQPAKAAFEFAARLDRGAAFAQNNLCYVALQQGDGPAAQQACEHALDLEPTMVAAHANLALAYALQGNVSVAEDRLMADADAATGLYNVGVLRMSMNEYSAAATAFDLATETRPSLGDAARRAVQARAKAAAVKEQ